MLTLQLGRGAGEVTVHRLGGIVSSRLADLLLLLLVMKNMHI
jgi:hypothetical protein